MKAGLTRLHRWSPRTVLGSGAILGELSFPYLGGTSSGASWPVKRQFSSGETDGGQGWSFWAVLNVSSACCWLWKSL